MLAGVPAILLIENDEADIFLFRRALSRLGFDGALRVVCSVSEARDYLDGHGSFDDREYYPLPDLIVCDMHLHGPTGNDFLEWIRTENRFAAIPFVFLSGSFVAADQTKSTELGAGAFYTKSGDIDVLVDRVRSILKFLPQVVEVK
jgi:two-component system response regulator